jgi:hypothetical protein
MGFTIFGPDGKNGTFINRYKRPETARRVMERAVLVSQKDVSLSFGFHFELIKPNKYIMSQKSTLLQLNACPSSRVTLRDSR